VSTCSDACGVGLRTIQHTVNEGKSPLNTRGCANFELLNKKLQNEKNYEYG
jgi:hypothetical protein